MKLYHEVAKGVSSAVQGVAKAHEGLWMLLEPF